MIKAYMIMLFKARNLATIGVYICSTSNTFVVIENSRLQCSTVRSTTYKPRPRAPFC